MPSIQALVADELEDYGDGDAILDYVSEGDGEPFDSLEKPIVKDESFPNAVVICNVPIIGQNKFTKLMAVMSKLVDKFGDAEKEMPFNEEGTTTEGFLIVNYKSFKDNNSIDDVCDQLSGMSLDKSHVLKVVKMDTFDSIANRRDEFEAVRTLSAFSRADFRDWLSDKKCREQILLRYQTETEIYWHDMMAGQPVLCYGGEREKAAKKVWCDWRVHWSPEGSYIATFHQQGIALWAGPEFEKKVRLPHPDVKEIQFSPNEEYLLMWNGALPQQNDDNAVKIYRILTGECVRRCRTPQVTPLGDDFPHFLWSPDAKYIAECNDSHIIVRDTDAWDIIPSEAGKRTAMKLEALKTFQWSPKDNVIAAWTLERENKPARLTLIEIPSRKELFVRSRMQCEAEMIWQSEGDFLCLNVTQLSKTKKRIATNLDIIRIRERNTPVDVVEIKDIVKGFFWETRGDRFAVITADEQGHKPRLHIFKCGKEKTEQIVLFDLPSNSFNSVIWAPEGQYFIVASVAAATGVSSSGDLLFACLVGDARLEILHKDEHYMLTDVSWDPSSRYVITSVTQPMQNDMGGYKYSMEAGYAIWTFQGRKLHQQQKEKLWAVAWRPHPPSLLPKQKQKQVRDNIKQYTKRYDALDDQAKESARAAFRREREDKTNAFLAILERLNEVKAERMEETGWTEARDEFLEGQNWAQEKEITEQQLGVTEELISG